MTHTKEVTSSNIREKVPRNSFIITIDGPTGTGKEVLARGLADRYDLTFLNTGVSIRALALSAIENHIVNVDDDNNIVLTDGDVHRLGQYIQSLQQLPRFEKPIGTDRAAVCYIGNRKALDAIHAYDNNADIEKVASVIAAIPKAREKLYLSWRQSQQNLGGVVVVGRKTGVDLFPHAHMKVYLVADPEASAQYRARVGISATRSYVTEEYYIKHRDATDAQAGLLEIPKGGTEINTTLYLADKEGEQLLVHDVIGKIDSCMEIV